MLRSFGISLIVIVACAASGCSTSLVYDCVDDTFTGFHDHRQAQRAWRRCKGCYYEVEPIGDFREGFKAGYLHVLNGGGSCRPTLPPRKYWSLCTRGQANHCRIVTWYNGWESGVSQAQHDGMGSGPLTTASDIYGTNQAGTMLLPEDLRRPADRESEAVEPALELFPLSDQLQPPAVGVPPQSKDAPSAAPYNPPALPEPEAPQPEVPQLEVPQPEVPQPEVPQPEVPQLEPPVLDTTQLETPVPATTSRSPLTPDDSLTPPAPPRNE